MMFNVYHKIPAVETNHIPTPALSFAPWKRSKMHHHGPQPLRTHGFVFFFWLMCQSLSWG